MSIKLVDSRDILLKTGSRNAGKGSWMSVGRNLLYIYRKNAGRSRWNISGKRKPRMSFNDKNLSLKIGTNKIVFKSPKKYTKVKSMLSNNVKKSRRKLRQSRKMKKSRQSRRSRRKLRRSRRKSRRYFQ